MVPEPPPAAALPERVLLVRLGAIGDVVNALLVAGALREHAPGVTIGWAVHDLARPLVEDNPAVDRVHVWERARGARGFLALVRELRAARYGLAVDLQRIAKSALVARLSGAPRVLGFDRARSKEGAWLLAREHTRPGDPGDHVVEQYRDVVRALGLPATLPPHPLPHDAAAEAWADERVALLGRAPLLVSLGASKAPNRWLPERFAELGRRLVERHGAPVAFVGAPADRALFDLALQAARGVDGLHDLVGATSLRQLAALLARARLLVSCDTGPMHLAAAVGCPVVALFGPASPRRTGPWGHARDGLAHAVVRPPEAGGRRMADLDVRSVLDAVAARLRAPGVVGSAPRP